jgi:hypothetical protein
MRGGVGTQHLERGGLRGCTLLVIRERTRALNDPDVRWPRTAAGEMEDTQRHMPLRGSFDEEAITPERAKNSARLILVYRNATERRLLCF